MGRFPNRASCPPLFCSKGGVNSISSMSSIGDNRYGRCGSGWRIAASGALGRWSLVGLGNVPICCPFLILSGSLPLNLLTVKRRTTSLKERFPLGFSAAVSKLARSWTAFSRSCSSFSESDRPAAPGVLAPEAKALSLRLRLARIKTAAANAATQASVIGTATAAATGGEGRLVSVAGELVAADEVVDVDATGSVPLVEVVGEATVASRWGSASKVQLVS